MLPGRGEYILNICGYIQVNVGVCVGDVTTNHGHVYHSSPVALVHSATAGTLYWLHVWCSYNCIVVIRITCIDLMCRAAGLLDHHWWFPQVLALMMAAALLTWPHTLPGRGVCGYIQVNVQGGVCVWDVTTNHGHVYHSSPVALVHSATAGTPYRRHVWYS